MKTILNKLKNAFLFAYYECYLQEHYFYKNSSDKNFQAITTLLAVIGFLLVFPLVIYIGNRINIGKYMYLILITIVYSFMLIVSKFIGNEDLSCKIDVFYKNQSIIKESKKIVWGFVIFCLALWIFVVMSPVE